MAWQCTSMTGTSQCKAFLRDVYGCKERLVSVVMTEQQSCTMISMLCKVTLFVTCDERPCQKYLCITIHGKLQEGYRRHETMVYRQAIFSVLQGSCLLGVV